MNPYCMEGRLYKRVGCQNSGFLAPRRPKRQPPLIDDSRGETARLVVVPTHHQPFQDVCVLWPVSLTAHRSPHDTPLTSHSPEERPALLNLGRTSQRGRSSISYESTLKPPSYVDIIWSRRVLGLNSRCLQGSGNLRLAVQLPDGEDTNEWLAVHGALLCVLSHNV